MTTTSMRLTADPVTSAAPVRRQPANSDEDRRAGWRVALECAWQRKVDEAIALTKVTSGLGWDDDGSLANLGMRVSELQARTDRAYEDLAAIEEAMNGLEDGTYGVCADCDRAMSDEWLAEKPEVRYCPDCSLRLVAWTAVPHQLNSARTGTGTVRVWRHRQRADRSRRRQGSGAARYSRSAGSPIPASDDSPGSGRE